MKKFRAKLEQERGRRKAIEESLADKKKNLIAIERDCRNIEQAVPIVQLVAQQTQEELQFHISELVSLALAAVWDDPYEFKISFVQKRGSTEAEIRFLRDETEIEPMTESGGGAVDVASFALRIALWNIQKPRSIDTLILDEPGRFISSDLQHKFGIMIKTLSEKLSLQFIIVTHSDELEESADAVFKVHRKRGISFVQ